MDKNCMQPNSEDQFIPNILRYECWQKPIIEVLAIFKTESGANPPHDRFTAGSGG